MTEEELAPFTAAEEAEGAEALVIALDGFEGPLHLLLELARAKKVDLARISIVEIADQYIAHIDALRAAQIELAGDYLVMAAWLAFLKSRLLLPKPTIADEEPDAEELALAFRLKLMRLAEARANAQKLFALPQLGEDVFAFGDPQRVAIKNEIVWRGQLYDLLQSYSVQRVKRARRTHHVAPRRAYPLADARKRLERMLDHIPDWRPIQALTPPAESGPTAPPRASYLASVFGAALELAREGRMDIRQAEAFAPLFLRARPPSAPTGQ